MELRHLRYFVAVADAGSVSAAAVRLRVTQPALSRQIRDLEGEFGVPVFDRVGRRLHLTAEGQDLLRRCRDVLADAEALGDRARAFKAGLTGLLRVGATPQTLESVLPDFLAGYCRAHPTIEVQLFEDGGPALLRRVEQGEFHLAVTVTGSNQLETRLLFPGRVLAVVTASHPLKRRATVEVKALANEPLLLLRRDFASRQWFEAACQVAHVRPRVLLESGAPHTLVALARAGHGVAIVPSNLLLARTGLHAAPVLLEGKSLGGWIAVNWDRRRFLPSYAKSFVDELIRTTSRSFPGKEFERTAPPVPRPRQR